MVAEGSGRGRENWSANLRPPSPVPRPLSERGTQFLEPNNSSINTSLAVPLSALQLLAVLHYYFQTNRLMSRVIRWRTQNQGGQPRVTGNSLSLC